MALPPIPLRSGQTPATPAAPQPARDARTAAQRAFFEAALSKAGATAPTAAPVRAQAQTRAVQPAVTRLQNETTVPPHPGRILRPGSLVDIKV